MQDIAQKEQRVTITQPEDEQPRHTPLTTREKISLSKRKITKAHLITSASEYLTEILNSPKEEKKVASVVGFCLYAGVSRSRMYELAQEWQEVADILEYISMLQEQTALEGGMTNKTNPVFSMFLLKSKHGYQDSPQHLTQNNTFNISPDLLADALKLMKENKK